jgi:hypothetical protein
MASAEYFDRVFLLLPRASSTIGTFIMKRIIISFSRYNVKIISDTFTGSA